MDELLGVGVLGQPVELQFRGSCEQDQILSVGREPELRDDVSCDVQAVLEAEVPGLPQGDGIGVGADVGEQAAVGTESKAAVILIW